LLIGLRSALPAGRAWGQRAPFATRYPRSGRVPTKWVVDGLDVPLVFVSRQIPPNGSKYWDVPNDLPGVGPHSRFRPAAPGRMLVREPAGAVGVLVDGYRPDSTPLHLIDVNAPYVSYDGTAIVFA